MTPSATERIAIPELQRTPVFCSRCVEELRAQVGGLGGVRSAEADTAAWVIAVEFDPEVIGADAVRMHVERIARELSATTTHTLFRVTGLDCPDCARTLDRSVSYLDEVVSADLNFTSAVLVVEHAEDVDPTAAVTALVRRMEYGIEPLEVGRPATPMAESWWQRNRIEALTAASGAALVAGSLVSLLDGPELLATVLFALAILAGGFLPARRAVAALGARTLDMNVLMTLAVVGAAIIGEWQEGAMVFFLFGIGNVLESRSLARTRRSIRDLMALAPPQVRVMRGTSEVAVPLAEAVVGDRVVVRPGERVPLDGVVRTGRSAFDEAPITGESVPVDKGPGDEVFAGSLNTSGLVQVDVTAVAEDSTLARIIYLVEEAQAQRAPFQRLVDRFTRYYTPAVIALAAAIALVPPALGALGLIRTVPFSEWFYRALVLLVVSCPCALVISTPVSIVSAISRASRVGLLVKGGAFLEAAARVRAVAFDKTGTLTHGRPEVAEVISLDGGPSERVLALAGALEAGSVHPLARAVVRAAGGGTAPDDLEEIPGRGVRGTVGGVPCAVGSAALATELGAMTPAAAEAIDAQERQGRTALVVVSVDDSALPVGVIGITDAVREGARAATDAVRREGVTHIAMLTGDNERTAEAVAAMTGVDAALSRLLPADKVGAIGTLKAEHGVVAMVGDGINDAPALAAADIGIAMGAAGSDAALETADVALMKDDLAAVAAFLRLGRLTVANIKQNVWFSVAVKAVVLVLGVAGYAPLWLAVFADTGVSLLVVLNGLRLLRARV